MMTYNPKLSKMENEMLQEISNILPKVVPVTVTTQELKKLNLILVQHFAVMSMVVGNATFQEVSEYLITALETVYSIKAALEKPE
jgi:hypothetical protein